ncbi:hypothetical protein [Gimesia aquarii]|uniref:Uncharacterized protein n=1 Tax=Gimesia aquarii TaxID=2527964 RepID=A0A517WRQ0_9PLAN|nr:hypothetical protein [Gimesia aquarii]QDU07930.1 hypothetical protein V202x_12910 [Gimesia aquarii]
MLKRATSRAKRPSLKVVIPVILFCTYYPYSWLILNDGSWTDYRWAWIKMWPGLPALAPRALFFHHVSDGLAFSGMLLISLVLVSLMIYLASLRRWLFGVIAPLVFILSALNSMLAYALYRA